MDFRFRYSHRTTGHPQDNHSPQIPGELMPVNQRIGITASPLSRIPGTPNESLSSTGIASTPALLQFLIMALPHLGVYCGLDSQPRSLSPFTHEIRRRRIVSASSVTFGLWRSIVVSKAHSKVNDVTCAPALLLTLCFKGQSNFNPATTSPLHRLVLSSMLNK